jgi:hypothetical protein
MTTAKKTEALKIRTIRGLGFQPPVMVEILVVIQHLGTRALHQGGHQSV